MNVKLDPSVIDLLRSVHGLTSFEQVGVKIGRSGHTVRQWYAGRSTPSAHDMIKLQFLTGRPYGSMLLVTKNEHAAA